jgi:hypothetical protein
MISLVVRALLWHRHKKTKPLGAFKPKLSEKLNGLFKRLYPLIAVGHDANANTFGPVVHEILYYTFTMPTSIKDQVATAMEQAVIFSILTPEMGRYLSPKVLCSLFCHAQRTGFSAILHAAWQGGIDKTYTMEDRSNATEQAGEDEEEEEDEAEEEEAEDDEVARAAENEMGDVEEEVELRSFHDQDGLSEDDFYERMDTERDSEIVEPLDDNAMEIMPDRPDEDEVMRLVDAQPHIS